MVNEQCLDMFFYSLRLAADNNIEGAKEVLHDIEARYMLSYTAMNYAMDAILGKHSNFSKTCVEQGLI